MINELVDCSHWAKTFLVGPVIGQWDIGCSKTTEVLVRLDGCHEQTAPVINGSVPAFELDPNVELNPVSVAWDILSKW